MHRQDYALACASESTYCCRLAALPRSCFAVHLRCRLSVCTRCRLANLPSAASLPHGVATRRSRRYFSDNALGGPIPSELAQLTSLTTLCAQVGLEDTTRAAGREGMHIRQGTPLACATQPPHCGPPALPPCCAAALPHAAALRRCRVALLLSPTAALLALALPDCRLPALPHGHPFTSVLSLQKPRF